MCTELLINLTESEVDHGGEGKSRSLFHMYSITWVLFVVFLLFYNEHLLLWQFRSTQYI